MTCDFKARINRQSHRTCNLSRLCRRRFLEKKRKGELEHANVGAKVEPRTSQTFLTCLTNRYPPGHRKRM